jgi:hypothetical protein
MTGSVIAYWRERLEAVTPYYNEQYLGMESCTRFASVQKSTWPSEVSLNATYADFAEWYRDTYVADLEHVEPYKSAPELLPKVPTRKAFLVMWRSICPPMVNTKHRVELPRYFEGTWFKEQKWQRFVKLPSWDDCVKRFESLTKSRVNCNISVV